MLFDSITDVTPGARGRVVVSGSHGGLYPGALAARLGLRAVVLNDAGRGFEGAGIAGILALDRAGMAAAGVDCMSCRIGSAEDMLARGRISVVNRAAAALGVQVGQPVDEAARTLADAPLPTGVLPLPAETRRQLVLETGQSVLLLDSASMVDPADAGAIIVTGSHGGLIGGNPARALKVRARVAVFNDAGLGADGIGITRLPALEENGVAAVTVSHESCRIGEASSALETGRISAVNALARAIGAAQGRALKDWLSGL